MNKIPQEIELVYSDVINQWKNGNYFKAYLAYMIAPYSAIFNIIGNFLKTESTLSENEASNIETIIMAGKQSGAKKMKLKLTKEEMTGIDLSILEKLKSKIGIKAIAGKRSNSQYIIEVEYN